MYKRLFLALIFLLAPAIWAQTTPKFSGLVVFGDSLSDDGNLAAVATAKYPFLSDPFALLNYDKGRFTDGAATNPAAKKYFGVWHEQLSAVLNIPVATASKLGGTDYAFGSATTEDGTQTLMLGSTSAGFSIDIENMGMQVSDFLNRGTAPDPAALYVVWGGANDLMNDSSDASVAAIAARVTALTKRLALAGAVNFFVPNSPPLGDVPDNPGNAQLTSASSKFRDQLNADLDALQTQLAAANTQIHLYRFDSYGLYLSVVTNPSQFGFTNVTNKAQGNATINPDAYLFWDGLHPTTGGHYQIALGAKAVLSAPASVPGSEPVISSVVNGASLNGPFASGAWVTIFGTNLSKTTRIWGTGDFGGGNLPQSLDGVSVKINGKPAYVYYISPTQLNVLAATDSMTGSVSVQVTTAAGASLIAAAVKAEAAPAFFPFDRLSRKYIAALNSDNSYSGPAGLFGTALTTRPARPKEIVQLYATGFGATSPAYPDGQVLTTSYPLAVTPRVTIGGQAAVVQYAGLVGPGLYQLNVLVPKLSDGDQAVVIDLGDGLKSADNVSYIAVKN
jgi:uncharacterized protein (TIGR03437 family)